MKRPRSSGSPDRARSSLSHSGTAQDFDLVAQFGNRLMRIQVKTSAQEAHTPNGHRQFPVSLVTCGGSQSWNGVAKVFDPSKVDYLFALTSAGRSWLIPATDLDGKRAVPIWGNEVLGVRNRGHTSRSTSWSTESAHLFRIIAAGGVSKRPKDGGCQRLG